METYDCPADAVSKKVPWLHPQTRAKERGAFQHARRVQRVIGQQALEPVIENGRYLILGSAFVCGREPGAYHQEHVEMQQRMHVPETDQDGTKAESGGAVGGHGGGCVVVAVAVLVKTGSETSRVGGATHLDLRRRRHVLACDRELPNRSVQERVVL